MLPNSFRALLHWEEKRDTLFRAISATAICTGPLERLRLQMRAWANSNVTFSSVLSAKVQRESYSTAYNCNSLSGVVSMLTDVGGTVAQLATGISDGKWGNAVKAGFGLLGKGYGVFTSIRDKDTAKPKYSVVNTIDGTIDTKGAVSGCKACRQTGFC